MDSKENTWESTQQIWGVRERWYSLQIFSARMPKMMQNGYFQNLDDASTQGN